MSPALVVERVGPQALVVDRGRAGWAHVGVPTAGALDGPALALALRLVGAPPGAAGVEVLLGGLVVRAEGATTIAVTGPPGAVVVARDGRVRRVAGTHEAVHLADGETAEVVAPVSGLRHYLAVAGGLDLPLVLGSRSSDTLSGLGPAPLGAGDRLPVGTPGTLPAVPAPVAASVVPAHVRVPVRLGPRDDWIADAADALRTTTWTVAPTGDRVGVRLEPPSDDAVLRRAPDHAGEELRSEGLVGGAVQVPPDGRPVVFLADHPTTGGYPVVGVVDAAALPAFAQARPGSTVRFVPS